MLKDSQIDSRLLSDPVGLTEVSPFLCWFVDQEFLDSISIRDISQMKEETIFVSDDGSRFESKEDALLWDEISERVKRLKDETGKALPEGLQEVSGDIGDTLRGFLRTTQKGILCLLKKVWNLVGCQRDLKLLII